MNEPGLKIRWIEPDSKPDNFPDPQTALTEPNGLLAIGGDLSVDRLVAAYGIGVFPWFSDDQPILWWSPDPRAVLFPDEFRISRSLAKTIRQDVFQVSIDQDFAAVITNCADRGDDVGTWITAEMIAAYTKLHNAGYAHSIEIWQENQLVGGLYGVNLGNAFFAESMYFQATNASKVALAALAAHCRSVGIGLIDCQMTSSHLAGLGSREISRGEFLRLLKKLKVFPAPRPWKKQAMGTAAAILRRNC